MAVAGAVLAIVLGSPASGLAQGRPPFRVSAADPLEIAWEDLEDPVGIHVWNDTGRERTLVTDIRFVGAPGVVTTRRRVELPRFGVATIRLRRPSSNVAIDAGTYEGTLTIRDRGSRAVVHRRASLVVAAPAGAKPAPLPAVDEWNARASRSPWASSAKVDAGLPLDGERQGSGATPLGIVVGEDGDSLTAVAAGPAASVDGAPHTLPVELLGDAPAGTYEGELDLFPGTDGGQVTAKIIVTDPAWLALALLAVGLVGGWLLKRYVGGGRRINETQQRLADAESAIDEADADFATRMDEEGIDVTTTVAPSVRDRLRKDDSVLRRLNRAFLPVPADDPSLEAVEANVELAEQHAKTLGMLARDLAALKDAVAEALQAPEPPPPPPPGSAALETPRALEWAQGLLTGTVDAQSLPVRAAEVSKALKLMTAWPALVLSLRTLTAFADAHAAGSSLPGAETKLLERARRRLRKVRWDLWSARDADDLAARNAVEELAAAERALSRLPEPEEPEPLTLTDAAPPLPLADGAPPGDTVAGLGALGALLGPPEEPVERAAWYEERRRLWDLVVASLVLGAVLWTAFEEVYLGEPFGGLYDMVRALLWGLGAKLSLDAAYTLVGSLRASRAAT